MLKRFGSSSRRSTSICRWQFNGSSWMDVAIHAIQAAARTFYYRIKVVYRDWRNSCLQFILESLRWPELMGLRVRCQFNGIRVD